jgi:hypothetical protein
MHHIKPITALTDDDLRTLAYEAADRMEDMQQANPALEGTKAHSDFVKFYVDRFEQHAACS